MSDKKIPLCQPDVSALEIKYVTEAIQKNWISSGAPPVKKFEEDFARKFDVAHAIAVNSGGSALFLAVKALGISPGDEVIVPTYTMLATAAAVSHCGATPVFVDAGKDSWNIDPDKIEERITPKTRAIMIAHIFGEPCEMNKIMTIAARHNLPVIEDAAEAHGATYREKYAGTIGTLGCFSFYASKIMTTGEGGMITTNDESLAKLVRRLREYDIDNSRPYIHELMSWNLRLSSLEAAVGLAQLERLEKLVRKRQEVAQRYENELKGIPEIRFLPHAPNGTSVVWLVNILAERRDELQKFLTEQNIESKITFVPLHRQPPYRIEENEKRPSSAKATAGKKEEGSGEEKFPNAEYLSAHALSIPSGGTLTGDEQSQVIAAIRKFYGK